MQSINSWSFEAIIFYGIFNLFVVKMCVSTNTYIYIMKGNQLRRLIKPLLKLISFAPVPNYQGLLIVYFYFLIPKVRRLNLSAQHVVYMHYTVGTLREKLKGKIQCWWVHQRQNEGSLYHFQYSKNIFTRLNDSRIKSISELVTSFVEGVNGDDSCSLCLEILYEVDKTKWDG